MAVWILMTATLPVTPAAGAAEPVCPQAAGTRSNAIRAGITTRIFIQNSFCGKIKAKQNRDYSCRFGGRSIRFTSRTRPSLSRNRNQEHSIVVLIHDYGQIQLRINRHGKLLRTANRDQHLNLLVEVINKRRRVTGGIDCDESTRLKVVCKCCRIYANAKASLDKTHRANNHYVVFQT